MKSVLLGTSVLAIVLSLGVSGCGGGSSSDSSTLTGTFVDAPVQGLKYVTATQSGVTDASGAYKYLDGEQVEFFLNTLSLGKVTATTLVTPYTLGASTTAAPSTKTQNIAMLLQNLDQNRSNSNTIVISDGLKDWDFSTLDISNPSFDNEVSGLLATNGIQQNIDNEHSLITAATATAKMKTYVEAEEAKQASDAASSSTTPASATYTLSASDISGYTLVTSNSTTVFASNGTFSNVKPDGRTTPGTWSVVDGKIAIQYSDTSDPEYWAFNVFPAKDAILTRTKSGEADQTGKVTSYSGGTTTASAVPSATAYTLAVADVSGYDLDYTDTSGVYHAFTFWTDGIFNTGETDTKRSSEGTWSIDNGKLKIIWASNQSTETLIFSAKPALGVAVTRTAPGEADISGKVSYMQDGAIASWRKY